MGYDPTFLGPLVPLPVAAQPVRELPATHFTVLLDPARRLAAATAVNVDGVTLQDVPRDDDWHLDPRVPACEQTGPELYARNDLDRGHLVRRRDPVWGDPGVAAQASRETFAYPNAAPQASEFNQGRELWLGLEDHVLEHARAQRLRLSVLTGPVLAGDDPVYRGVRLPLRFWKVAAWALDGGRRLAAAAFVLDQSPLLPATELAARTHAAAAADQPPPLGPFRTFQVPVADVADLTALDLGPLTAADVLAVTAPQSRAWRELAALAEVDLGT
ncbi:DNA/RNA non-specific endonuclease [Cellulomonas sp. Sa3CUA2]|uniref:DNA/RNA non-specific endonuclease n=1 Tax=Cellulomonas avistercoris TaxID=2762242 RepID=A0ABR8QDI1_9CELL|nr:DNA/RNA non-specific endonuclease [Cellulomonas avistercoris]MBD7918492.1 DNA/RNA non-specific endonuclease [Cellulomonas avistercoris]